MMDAKFFKNTLKKLLHARLGSFILQSCVRMHFRRILNDKCGSPTLTPLPSDLEIKLCALTNWNKYFSEIIPVSSPIKNVSLLNGNAAIKTASWNTDIKAALKYSSLAIPGFFNSLTCNDIIKNIPAEITGETILDIGSGTGILAIKLAMQGYGVDAVDVSTTQLAVLNFLKGKLPITTYQCNAFNLENIGKKYACCTSRWFMSHFSEQDALLASIGMVIRPGGYFIYDMDNEENLALAQSNRHFDTLLTGYTRTEGEMKYYKASSLTELEEVAQKNHFRLVRRIPELFFHNNIFASVLQSDYIEYMGQIREFAKNSQIREFIEFFKNKVTANLPAYLSFRSIIVLQKL